MGSSGAYFSSSNGSIEWTLGEPIIATTDNSSNILTQGFHQTKLFAISINEKENAFELNVYPNPTTNYITLETSQVGNLKAELYSLNGGILLQSQLQSGDQINMMAYAKGSYVLKVYDGSGARKTFQIIKH